MTTKTPTLLIFLILFTGCGRSQDQNSSKKDSTGSQTELPVAVKKDLERSLLEARKRFSTAPNATDAQQLTQGLYGCFHTLTVIVKAIDHSGDFTKALNEEIERFAKEDSTRSGDAGKIVNGMSGVYAMYSLLYKMRFHTEAERMNVLEEYHSEVVASMHPKIPAVDAVAAMAKACYLLSIDIMENIDKEKLYSDAFAQIDQQYQAGKATAKISEDHFLNGMYRTFEVSQLWALFVNPKSRQKISEINKGFHSTSAGLDNIGGQMAAAAHSLFQILELIAQSTINLN